jgi:hypothetical protein
MTEKFLDKVYDLSDSPSSIMAANMFTIKTIDNPSSAQHQHHRNNKHGNFNVTVNHPGDELRGRLTHVTNNNVEDKYLREMSNSINNGNGKKQLVTGKRAENIDNDKNNNNDNVYFAEPIRSAVVVSEAANDSNNNGRRLNKKQLVIPNENENSRPKANAGGRGGGRHGILIKSVTVDHSKDYTSSSDGEDVIRLETGNRLIINNNGNSNTNGRLQSSSELVVNSNSSLQSSDRSNTPKPLANRFVKNMLLSSEKQPPPQQQISKSNQSLLIKNSSYNNSSMDEEQSSNTVVVVPLDPNSTAAPPTTAAATSKAAMRHVYDNDDDEDENDVRDDAAEYKPKRTGSGASDVTSAGTASLAVPTPSLDLSMFDLLDKTSKKFVLKPATLGLNIRCQIYRQKGMYPK